MCIYIGLKQFEIEWKPVVILSRRGNLVTKNFFEKMRQKQFKRQLFKKDF